MTDDEPEPYYATPKPDRGTRICPMCGSQDIRESRRDLDPPATDGKAIAYTEQHFVCLDCGHVWSCPDFEV